MANYVLLETIELTQAAASVTFDNIPQTGYTDLKIVASMRVTDGGEGSTPPISRCELTFNGTGTNYTIKMLYGIPGATPTVNTAGGIGATRNFYNGAATSSNATANTYSNAEYYIPNYSSSTISKSFGIKSNIENGAQSSEMDITAGIWNSTAAITSIKINPYNLGSFAANSTFSLYGIAATGTTPTIAPYATGGNIVANDGTYWYHAFLNSGTFTPQKSLTCDLLQVAGGGGGDSGGGGGGGGAGGYLTFTNQSLLAQNYTVTIGAGGAASGTTPSAGSNTQFGSLTASVGGGRAVGGGASPSQGNGGSGGGATGGQTLSGGTATPSGQGYNGGSATFASPYGGAGGGGAGGVGGNGGVSSTAGAGGNGLYTAISGGATTGLGQLSGGNYYFAGGGGGARNNVHGGTAGAGGLGGGGNGGGQPGTSGTVNTGGGGGGNEASGGSASSGGSGIVIIRYAM